MLILFLTSYYCTTLNLRFTIKQLGKKQALFTEQIIAIDYDLPSISLKNLIAAIVEYRVEEYNRKTVVSDNEDTPHNPLRNYIDLLTETGNAKFGNIYNESKADVEKAIENALICFEDGIIAVFQGEEQINALSQEIDLTKDNSFTFLRLTFLVGSYW